MWRGVKRDLSAVIAITLEWKCIKLGKIIQATILGMQPMVREKQLEPNRQNALPPLGSTTGNRMDAVKLNALRHGLRSFSRSDHRRHTQRLSDELTAAAGASLGECAARRVETPEAHTSQFGRLRGPYHRLGQRPDVARRDEAARFLWFDNLSDPTCVEADHGHCLRKRIEEDPRLFVGDRWD